MPTEASNGDQRVTNATILGAVNTLKDKIDDLSDQVKEIDKRQRLDHDSLTKVCTQVETNKTEIGSLRTKSDFWSSLNSLGVVIAGVLGVNK